MSDNGRALTVDSGESITPKEVELIDISKAFEDTIVVDHINLDVKKGIFFTLLGPSGCGKTTTLRIIAGLLKPDHGDLYIGGTRVTDTPTYLRNLGMVFQSYALFPHMSVRDNVAFGLKVRRFSTQEKTQLVDEVLKMTNLSGFEKRFPKELSGGQQQRVALARAIVFKPSVLLLDEPLSNLDLKVRMQMRREIKSLTKRLNTTTINVTHDQGEALSMSDVIGVVDKGRLVQVGTPNEIYERPANPFVANFIGETNFLEAKVSGIDESYLQVDVHSEMSVYVEHDSQEGKNHQPGHNVLLSVRPEKVQITRHKLEGKNVFLARVEDADYFGSFIRYTVNIGDVKLNCELRKENAKSVERGDKVYVSFDPRDCFVSKA